MTGTGWVGDQFSTFVHLKSMSKVCPDPAVWANCSIEQPAAAPSSRPSWAITRTWLPCGWNGWLTCPRWRSGSAPAAIARRYGLTRTSAPYGCLGS